MKYLLIKSYRKSKRKYQLPLYLNNYNLKAFGMLSYYLFPPIGGFFLFFLFALALIGVNVECSRLVFIMGYNVLEL